MFSLRARSSIAVYGIWIVAGCRSAGPAPAPATAATPDAQRAPFTKAFASMAPPEPLELSATSATPTMAEILIAPPSRVVADLNRLGRELPVRLGDQMLESLLSKAAEAKLPIDGQLLSELAPDRPLSLIFVARGQGTPPGRCVAAPLARAGDGERVAAKLGTPVSRRGGAVERRTGGGMTFWSGVSDATLLLAQSYDDLWSMGARALAATRKSVPAEEVVMTVDPDAIRAATGSTWAELAQLFRHEAEKTPVKLPRRGGKGTSPPEASTTAALQKMMLQLGDGLAAVLSEIAHVRLGIAASSTDGLVMSAAIEPRPGTPLAARAAAATSFTLDERLPVRDDRTGFTAWGSLDVFAPVLRALLPGAPARRGGPPGPSPIDGFLSTFSGAGSCTFEFSESPPSSVCSLPLRPGADGRAALKHYAELVDAVMAWEADIVGTPHRPASQIRKGVLEFERPLSENTVSAEQYAMMRSFMGGDTMKYAAAVRGDRLLQFQGGSPRARLQAWTDGAKAKPAPALPALQSQVLARMHGYSAATLMDPMVLLFTMFEHATDPRTHQAATMLRALPGLATTRIPLMFAAPSGPNLAYELHVPVVTFDNIGKLIRPFAGMMGGGGGTDGAGPPGQPH